MEEQKKYQCIVDYGYNRQCSGVITSEVAYKIAKQLAGNSDFIVFNFVEKTTTIKRELILSIETKETE